MIVSLLSLIYLLASPLIPLNLMLAGFILYLYVRNGLSAQVLLRLVFYAFFFALMFLILAMIYPAEKFKVGESINILSFNFYHAALNHGLKNFVRLFLLSLVSMSSTYAINYTRVILYLVLHKKMTVFMGYPLLIALNSILLFKAEFERIRLSARFRGLGWWHRLFILFPLLVFAIRHSQRGSLSLVTRGLNPEKSFYFTYPVMSNDRLWLRLFLAGFLGLVAITIYFR